MRTLKFMVWDKNNKCWLKEGQKTLPATLEIRTTRNGFRLLKGKESDFIYCQAIGLKDMNKKDIYEGHLLGTKRGDNIFIVVHGWDTDHKAYGWNIRTTDSPYEILPMTDPKNLEIIGHIFEQTRGKFGRIQ